MDDPIFIDQCGDIMDSFDEELAAVLGEDFHCSLSPESNSSSSTLIQRSSSSTSLCGAGASALETTTAPHPVLSHLERPAKQHKPNSYNINSSSTTTTTIHHNMTTSLDQQPSSSPIILSFGAGRANNLAGHENNNNQLQQDHEVVSDHQVQMSPRSYLNLDHEATTKTTAGAQTTIKKSSSRTRPPSQTYDHIIAERKRREQLSQRFVALSAIVPGLKKMDKTSVLGDAIKYLKQLQERVKTLEEQATKQTVESVVLVKKSQILLEDEGSSDEKSSGAAEEQPLPEIEVRVCDKKVLLRINCEKHKGVLVKILTQVEKHNLSVVNTNVAPFGSLALDITIIAEMEKEFTSTVKDLVQSLRSALSLRRIA